MHKMSAVYLHWLNFVHLQKMVVKGEEEENRLYNKVREAEYARQKQEQNVKRLQAKAQATKNKHSQEMKRQLTEMIKVEKENEQKVLREQAILDRVGKSHSLSLDGSVYCNGYYSTGYHTVAKPRCAVK